MKLLAIPLMLVASPLVAQSSHSTAVETMEIDLKSFAFTPATITLKHGVPYRLRLVNTSGGGHDFVAKAFFAEATIDPASKAIVRKGEVELGGGERADVQLVANRPGTYEVHCSHFMHSTFGMTGRIIVT